MNVRVIGPNLRDQSKGSFHVHADGCAHLGNYGPGRKLGGDVEGDREMLVTDATVVKVVFATYADQIGESVGDEFESVVDALERGGYVEDFYFAPCCADLPKGEVVDDPDNIDEPRTAEAATVIVNALRRIDLQPSGVCESGNLPVAFNFTVEINGHDYDVEVAALTISH